MPSAIDSYFRASQAVVDFASVPTRYRFMLRLLPVLNDSKTAQGRDGSISTVAMNASRTAPVGYYHGRTVNI